MPKQLDWQALLVDGYEPLRKAQRVFRHLPHDPRCKLCRNPFGGVGGKLVGVAANAGIAFVGNVGSGTVMDFTALGDAVNVGARLQSYASAGEVVLASDLYTLVAADHPTARPERVAVRGRDKPVDAMILTV